MQIRIRQLHLGIRLITIILILPFLFSHCTGDPIEVPEEDVFTKEKREQLGELLMTDILAKFDFLPKESPYDDSVYWFVKTMYGQATLFMQLDKQSPPDNRWAGDWEVYIIDDNDTRHAFILPGGDLFITTGMLRSFEKTYELYYLLTFEATLMHENHLLDALKNEYNSLTLLNLIEGRPTASGITISNVADDLPDLEFETAAIYAADRETVFEICETSNLEPTGINPFLTNGYFEDSEWLASKPNYPGRTMSIQGFADEHAGDCGGNLGNGLYQTFVLDVLE